MTKSTKTTYWTFTLLFGLLMAMSGVGFLLPLPPAAQGMVHLGYPPYLVRFLGLAKLLAAVAVLAGTFPKIKEWAYAGSVFDLLGAAYSHANSGDGPKTLVPLVVLCLCIISYVYWKKLNAAREQSARHATDAERLRADDATVSSGA